jgi:ribosomal protein S18 acetylase RimI-like enzyme
MNIHIRPFQPADLAAIKELTVSAFNGVTLEQNVEEALGELNGHDWQWRKARHVDDDVAANAEGIFVAVSVAADVLVCESGTTEQVVGYISTIIDRASGRGRIPNLAVAAELRGQGLGRQLIEHALDYFRAEGLAYATIETMAQNAVGQHLYQSCGFIEVARQVHFARRL